MSATRTQIAGQHVAANTLDDDLHIETTTIMFADVVESVRLIEQDELANVSRIRALLMRLADEATEEFGGVLLERRGDGLLIKFENSRRAIWCAQRLHQSAATTNVGFSGNDAIMLRIGLHRSEMLSDDDAIYGRGINTAARVTALAGPGETVLSDGVRDSILVGIDTEIEDLGECYVKNLSTPIRAYRVVALDGLPVASIGADTTTVEPTIAVMRFATRLAAGADAASVNVADLLSESIIHVLARVSSVRVVSWLSSRCVSEAQKSLSEIGALLSAQWIARGTCYVDGTKLVVDAELANVETGQVAWAVRTRADVSDLLQADSTVGSELAQGIAHCVVEAEAKRVAKHSLPTLKSHTILTGAVGLMHRSQIVEFARSREALEYLLERHPRMHAVRPWLAQWYVLNTTRGLAPPQEDFTLRALDQTSRALDSLPDDARSLAVRGFVFFHLRKDIQSAAGLVEKAYQLNPNDPYACVFSAAIEAASENTSVAWQRARRGLDLAPLDPLRDYFRMLAAACAMSNDLFEDAERLAKDSCRENAMHPVAWRTLTIVQVLSGKIEDAKQSCSMMLRAQPNFSLKVYGAASPLAPDARERAIDALRIAGAPN